MESMGEDHVAEWLGADAVAVHLGLTESQGM